MKKCGRLFSLIMIVALMMINSITVLGAEGEDLGSWVIRTSMPTARSALGLAEVNGKIYAIGGENSDGTKLNVVEEYTPATDSWTTKASMPTARYALGVVEVNGKIYAIGGSDVGELGAVEEYDPVTDTWTTKASMPTARNFLGVVKANGKIYAISGAKGQMIKTVEEYDPITDTWISKSNIPTARGGLGVAEANGKIYAIGGWLFKYLNTVEEYDPVTDTWTTKASMKTAIGDVQVAEANGKLYVIGGSNGNYLNTVEEYDPVTNTWYTKAVMPTARYRLGLVEANGKIYAIGGSNGNNLNTVEVFTPPNHKVTAPLDLTATPNSDSILLNWAYVTDADSYTILRSTTSSTIDTIIASNITDTTYTDTNVTPGVIYYYVIRAVKNGVESADSNVASAMIEISNNRALLLIKLLDENDKEYDLPMSDVDTFMSWYFDRVAGQGPAYYTFTKDYNAGPYISRKDYISYDKIICIEVNEYIE
ncbi:galactose oxidase [Vallitalea pronyensis]|uniref:Galactose oxidase n=1 Tax=Vallitalea pronyensis TaxID=1348613 RepID=A0A8J8SH54_9FIRM|nr:kelch repeat-containing protein [Vallitalea pronyensis]QUI23008.1 galactose oxidase [Vallitalea pronyensis]